jgi:hypothetical protein
MSFRWLPMLLMVWELSPGFARPDGVADDIPVVGRPADLPFSGASGHFAVQTRAEPTALRRDEVITFTIVVRATGPVGHAPDQIDLRKVSSFAAGFYVEDTGERVRRPDDQTWEFVYRLKPRRDNLTEIPALPFVYYDPAIRPTSRGFQIAFTDAIPLTLKPAESYVPAPLLPPEVYRIEDGPDLIAHARVSLAPVPLLMALLLAGPPLACAGWYLAWRSFYRDVASRARQRRSRAARESLKRLRKARRLPLPQRADEVAATLTCYLRERFELSAAEPTPAEAASALAGVGCPADLAEAASRFVASTDAARFAPQVNGVALVDEAVQLIAALEEQTWESLPS